MWGAALAGAYAVFVRFYHAAGGQIGLPGTIHPDFADTFARANYAAGLLILVGGLACLVLTHHALRRVPRRSPVAAGRTVPPWVLGPLCVAPVLLGAIYAGAHAISGVVTKLLDLAAPGTITYPGVFLEFDRTAVALWDILFYEPWFLAMGLCLYLSAWRYLRDHGATRAALRRLTWLCATGATALGGYSIWLVVTDITIIG